jgi:hypothetical protein
MPDTPRQRESRQDATTQLGTKCALELRHVPGPSRERGEDDLGVMQRCLVARGAAAGRRRCQGLVRLSFPDRAVADFAAS